MFGNVTSWNVPPPFSYATVGCRELGYCIARTSGSTIDVPVGPRRAHRDELVIQAGLRSREVVLGPLSQQHVRRASVEPERVPDKEVEVAVAFIVEPSDGLAPPERVRDTQLTGGLAKPLITAEEELVRPHACAAVRTHRAVQVREAVSVRLAPGAAVPVDAGVVVDRVVPGRVDEVDVRAGVRAAVVDEQIRLPPVPPDEQVRVAIAIVVGPERAPRFPRPHDGSPRAGRHGAEGLVSRT